MSDLGVQYHLLTSTSNFVKAKEYLSTYRGVIGFDTETMGQEQVWVKGPGKTVPWNQTAEMTGFSFSTNKWGFYAPVAHQGINASTKDARDFLEFLFERENPIAIHNYQYDGRVVRNFMGDGKYRHPKQLVETLILMSILQRFAVVKKKTKFSQSLGLKDLTESYLRYTMIKFKEVINGRKVLIGGLTDEDIEIALEEFEKELCINNGVLSVEMLKKKEFNKIESQRKSLAKKCRVYRNANMGDMTGDEVLQYACDDAICAMKLASRFLQELEQKGMTWYVQDHLVRKLYCIMDMEDTGLQISQDAVVDIRKECQEFTGPLKENFFKKYEKNIASNADIGSLIAKHLEGERLATVMRTDTNRIKTDKEALEYIKKITEDDHLLRDVIEQRETFMTYSKIEGTYTDGFIRQLPYSPDGRLHPTFNLHIARTGRLSSSGPNMQNLPAKKSGMPDVRSVVVAGPGKVLLSVDYSQIEIVVLAHHSQDENLLRVVNNGESMHDITAKALGCERKLAKTYNFGKNYMAGPATIAAQLGRHMEQKTLVTGKTIFVAPPDVAENCKLYDETYPGVILYQERMAAFACKYGYVETMLGRRRYLPEIKQNKLMLDKLEPKIQKARRLYRRGKFTKEQEKQYITLEKQFGKLRGDYSRDCRIACNTPIQGDATDIIDIAMLKLYSGLLTRRREDVKLLLNVHDELVFEVTESCLDEIRTEIVHVMENSTKLSVPIKAAAAVGRTWTECK